MSDDSLPKAFSEFRTPAILRGAAFFCLLFIPLLLFISFMAWWVEDAIIGLWMLPLWVAMELYWLWQWRIWAKRMRIYEDRLEVMGPFTVGLTVPFEQVTALKLGRGVLHLITTQEYLSIRGDVNTLTQVASKLESTVPRLRLCAAATSILPIRVDAQKLPILLINLFGLLIGGMGIGLTSAALSDPGFENRWMAVAFGLAMMTIAGVLLYWLLFTFVWYYRFDVEQIEARHTFQSEVYPSRLLRQIEMKQRDVTSRGITKTLYTLEMHFADDRELLIQPGAQNYPLEYAELHERVSLEKLLTQLRFAYQKELQQQKADLTDLNMSQSQPVARIQLEPANLPWEGIHAPDFAYQLHAVPAKLTVWLLNYGERQPGAETVQIRLSRPVEGKDLFDTTNGNAIFSASGRLLLLHDSFLPIVIDTATMRAWHYTITERTFLLDPEWEGERLVGKTLGYGKPIADAEKWGAWSWEEIIRDWQPGLGKWARQSSTQFIAAAGIAPQQRGTRRAARTQTARTRNAPNIPEGISEQLWRKLNFIELNPDWVMLGDGTVFAAPKAYLLPRQIGEHVVGGEIQFLDQALPQRAAFVMDSTLGGVTAVYVKQDGQWRRVVEALEWMRPHVNFADLESSPPDEDRH